jgi:molecular chaperone GrpE (heat shock protein)
MKQQSKTSGPSQAENASTTQQQDTTQLSALEQEVASLREQLRVALEREKRSLADYQNLVRRTQEERAALVKFANKDLCEALLQPLEHLSLAALSLHDKGLDMVLAQFWKELARFGLSEMEVLGKTFDVATMEVVEKRAKGERVIEVVRKGYLLSGEVLQHAQVILD